MGNRDCESGFDMDVVQWGSGATSAKLCTAWVWDRNCTFSCFFMFLCFFTFLRFVTFSVLHHGIVCTFVALCRGFDVLLS